MRDKHQQPHAGAVHKTERAPALAQHGTARPGEPHYQGCLVELVPKPFNVVVHEQKLGRHPKKTKQGVKRTENNTQNPSRNTTRKISTILRRNTWQLRKLHYHKAGYSKRQTLSKPRAKMSYTIAPALTPIDYTTASTLFHAYASSLNLDLTFQNFTNELANLQKMYSPPAGVLLLAKLESTAEDSAIGCVGVRALDPSLGICEMKRLYVGPEGRGKGIGKALAQRALLEAKRSGYVKMRLDTLATMTAALELYRGVGFKEIDAYYHNPLDGVVYLEADLN